VGDGDEWDGDEWDGDEWDGDEWDGDEWDGDEWDGDEWDFLCLKAFDIDDLDDGWGYDRVLFDLWFDL
jgi:hypothetical protein